MESFENPEEDFEMGITRYQQASEMRRNRKKHLGVQ